MATRRMFNKTIMMTDDFLELPPTAKVLYMYLNLEADDYGFIGNPRTIIRLSSTTSDDLRILITKGYAFAFDSGVIVITDWNEHNKIRKDRITPTRYTQELEQITLLENRYYIESIEHCDLSIGSM